MYKEFYFYDRKYKIDEFGNITRCAYVDERHFETYTVTRHNKETAIHPFVDRNGYLSVILNCSNTRKYFRVHHLSYLVWKKNQTYFESKCYIGYDSKSGCFDQIDHVNGDKQDNRPENLELVSLQENIKRSVENKTHDSQLKALYVSVYKGGIKQVTVFRLKEVMQWFLDNTTLKPNGGTLSAHARNGKPWHGYIIKYESNDYRKS